MTRKPKAAAQETPQEEQPKAFWDHEEQLGFAEVTTHKQIEIVRAEKDGKEYIALTEWKYFKDRWNRVKGITVTPAAFESIREMLTASWHERPPLEDDGIEE